MNTRSFGRASRWLNLPSGVLIALLQRSPVVQAIVAAGEYVIASPVGNVIKGVLTAAASLGAVNSLAGATTLSATTASPLTATVGTPVSVAFTVLGTQTPAMSWTVGGNVPAGLALYSTSSGGSGATSGNVDTSAGTLYLRGTPTTAGAFSFTVRAWEFAGGTGNQSPNFTYVVNVSGGTTATAPAITEDPLGLTTSPGSNVYLSVNATGSALSYQWTKGGVAIPGATNATLILTNAQAANSGDYAAVVTNSAGSATSHLATVTVGIVPAIGSSARLINISTRSLVGTGGDVQIAGFVISGSTPKKVVVRASGPALTQFGVSGVLADPKIELKDSNGTTILENNDWSTTIQSDFNAVGAWAWPVGSKDAAVVATLQPGLYSAIVSGQNGGTGVALIEAYEEDIQNIGSRLVNISTRSLVGTGGDVQIAGFIISGSQPKTVVIRASGPALTQFGVPGVLADPFLELYSGGGTKLSENDNWDASVAVDFTRVNAWAWPANSKDAAMVVTLPPGGYTAKVSGKNNGTGVSLIEVFEE